MLASDITVTVNGADASSFVASDELVRAVIISLFTWRRANADDAVEGSRMGWHGDTTATVPGDRIGSRLWLLAREKILPATINRAREYAQEALQWLIDDGVARRVAVETERRGIDGIALQVTIYRADGGAARLRFDNVWEHVRAV